MKLATLSIACMAGYARAFVVPPAARSSFAQPAARAGLSTAVGGRGAASCPRMSIAIVTVRTRGSTGEPSRFVRTRRFGVFGSSKHGLHVHAQVLFASMKIPKSGRELHRFYLYEREEQLAASLLRQSHACFVHSFCLFLSVLEVVRRETVRSTYPFWFCKDKCNDTQPRNSTCRLLYAAAVGVA